MSYIDWDTAGQVHDNLPLGLQRWFCKFASSFVATARRECLWGRQDHCTCCRCNSEEEEEDTRHVVKCKSPTAVAKWNFLLKKVGTWMAEKNTEPNLRLYIINGLSCWHQNLPQRHRPGTRQFQDAFKEQDEIGWWNFLLGRATASFAEIQERHYRHLKSDRGGKVWLRGLLKQVLDIPWQMWEHRNSILHGTLTNRDQAELENLQQTVREEFAKGRRGLHQMDHNKLTNREWLLEQNIEFL